MSKKYITTPIYYVNGDPHIGHAYTSIAADVAARMMRLFGDEVYFLTGTDEHGQKVEKSAITQGIAPQDFANQISQQFRDLAQKLGISNNDFIRTTEQRHKDLVLNFWKKLEASGYIYKGKYSGWYALRDEAFYSEKELVSGVAPTGAPVEWVEEESYFFRLSAFTKPLLQLYQENPDFVAPKSRYNEVISFVRGGLEDISISRTNFSWGIPVDGDESHLIYVWLDALVNYLIAPNGFWPADIHIVGKDILRFHAIYWPAFLLAADMPPPRRIFAHGWWQNEGQKISKSLGNGIDPIALIDEFGLDSVRYFLMREVPFGNDGNFSRTSLVLRINAELSNNLGNLLQRVATISYKKFGAIPTISEIDDEALRLLELPTTLLIKIKEELLPNLAFDQILNEIMAISDDCNSYINKHEPWKLNGEALALVLYTALDLVRQLAILLQPFIPASAKKILDILVIPNNERNFDSVHPALLTPVSISQPSAIFPRLIYEVK